MGEPLFAQGAQFYVGGGVGILTNNKIKVVWNEGVGGGLGVGVPKGEAVEVSVLADYSLFADDMNGLVLTDDIEIFKLDKSAISVIRLIGNTKAVQIRIDIMRYILHILKN